jgi:hypothetical protein
MPRLFSRGQINFKGYFRDFFRRRGILSPVFFQAAYKHVHEVRRVGLVTMGRNWLYFLLFYIYVPRPFS